MTNQHKNEYYFSGAIVKIEPVKEYKYKGSDGEEKIRRSRELIAVNKFRRKGYWIVSHALFECVGDCVEELQGMKPGLEVIIRFRIKGIFYERQGEQKFFQKLEAFNIMSPTDKIMSEKWMSYKNLERSNGSKEPESSPSLTEKQKADEMPETKRYEYGKRTQIEETDDFVDAKSKNDDLPF